MPNQKQYRPRCHYCGHKATTKDHIVPRARGGKDARWNLVDACFPCNNAKADAWPTCGCTTCLHAARKHRRRRPLRPLVGGAT